MNIFRLNIHSSKCIHNNAFKTPGTTKVDQYPSKEKFLSVPGRTWLVSYRDEEYTQSQDESTPPARLKIYEA